MDNIEVLNAEIIEHQEDERIVKTLNDKKTGAMLRRAWQLHKIGMSLCPTVETLAPYVFQFVNIEKTDEPVVWTVPTSSAVDALSVILKRLLRDSSGLVSITEAYMRTIDPTENPSDYAGTLSGDSQAKEIILSCLYFGGDLMMNSGILITTDILAGRKLGNTVITMNKMSGKLAPSMEVEN